MIEERRAEPRGRLSTYANPLYRALRASAEKADTLIGAVRIFLVAGLIVAAIGTAIFVSLASHVRSGSTQAFDDPLTRVHHWRNCPRRNPETWIQSAKAGDFHSGRAHCQLVISLGTRDECGGRLQYGGVPCCPIAQTALGMATLEAIQKFGTRRDPRILQDELPAPKQVASGSPYFH